MEQGNFRKKLERADEKLTDVAGAYVGIVFKIIVLVGMTFCAFALAALLTIFAISTYSAIYSAIVSQLF